MQVSQQTRTQKTRVQKKRENMAAKKLAKETGIPLPKKPRNTKPRKKPAPVPERMPEPKPSAKAPSIARTHTELFRLMEAEKHLLVNPNDVDYPDKPAYEMDFYVSKNLKNLSTTLEFPDESVTFLDPKKCCADLCKMLADIGIKYMRVFPNWRDFQPFYKVYAFRGEEKGYCDYNEQPLTNVMGIDYQQIENFKKFAD